MFARTFRPAARTLRVARSVRTYTASPVVRAAQAEASAGVKAVQKAQAEAEHEGGKILLMFGGAIGALVTVGSILDKQRKERVHPSEPKEAEEAEEEEEETEPESLVEEIEEAVSGESPNVNMISRNGVNVVMEATV